MADYSKDDLAPFNPGDALYRGKLWVRVVAPTSVRWHFFWRRIAMALAALALVGWLALAGAAWTFVKYQRGYAEVSFADLAFYPVRSSHYRIGLGRHYLAQGRIELEKKNYLTGYQLLLAGLTRVPDDVTARRLVAFTQVRLGRSDLALKTLTDGASLATTDLDYLKLLFALLHEAHEDDRILALAGQLLPPTADAVLTHQFVALQAATAHFERGRYEAAERLLGEWRLTDSLEGEILLARCDWERGLPDLALARLERELARFPKRDELYLHLVRFYRDLGRFPDARRFALLRQFNDPASPGARVDLLHNYFATGDRPAAARELDSFLAAFRADATALTLLAWLAVDTAQPALATTAHDLALAQSFPITAFNLARVQTAIAAQDYAAALKLADASAMEENEDNPNFLSTLNGLRAVAHFGLKDASRAALMLTAFLNQTKLRAGDALLLARELRPLGATAATREVLDRAVALDPLNESALAELIRLDTETGNHAALIENLPKFLRLRKPSRLVLQEALLRLVEPTDGPLREEVRAALGRVTASPTPE